MNNHRTKLRNSKVLVANILATINSAVVGLFLVLALTVMRLPGYAADFEAGVSASMELQNYDISIDSLMQMITILFIGFLIVMVIMAALGWFAYVMNNKGLVLATAIIYVIVGIILLLLFNFVALLIFGFYYVACGLYIYAYSQMSHTYTVKPNTDLDYPVSSYEQREDDIHIID